MEYTNNLLSKDNYYKLYGGLNKDEKPFKIGSILKQKYTIDKFNNLEENGREVYKIIGYKNKLMILEPLNEAALLGVDTFNQLLIKKVIKAGYNPRENTPTYELHIMYADRFKIIKKSEI